jgi:branched-subunit amino acid ABC-type transport system permease component
VGGGLIDIYYNSVDIGMGYSAGLKGFSAMVIGGGSRASFCSTSRRPAPARVRRPN